MTLQNFSIFKPPLSKVLVAPLCTSHSSESSIDFFTYCNPIVETYLPLEAPLVVWDHKRADLCRKVAIIDVLQSTNQIKIY